MTKAKKSLGQNFLRDKKILKKIADFAQIEKTDTVVEVGPGEGSLTGLLLEKAGKVIAIEKDENLAKKLRENFKLQISNNKLEIVNADVLELPEEFFSNYKLVGNIPYYITGALFKKFLELENQPKSITFVVQKEVADRIMAKDKKESILSISIKAYGKPEYGGIIKAGSFNPKPKVDSAIIAIRNISKKRFENDLIPIPSPFKGEGGRKEIEKKFFEILKKGFAHKRKLLARNLISKGHPLGQNSSRVTLAFATCGITEKARAENLSVDNWICLTQNLL